MNWKPLKEKVLKLLKEHKSIPEIATAINVKEYDLRRFIHRAGLHINNSKGRNITLELITILMRDKPQYFKPTREFFLSVRIRQKRWWQLYRGEKRITEEEYKRLTSHLGITLDEAMDARQLDLFDHENTEN